MSKWHTEPITSVLSGKYEQMVKRIAELELELIIVADAFHILHDGTDQLRRDCNQYFCERNRKVLEG